MPFGSDPILTELGRKQLMPDWRNPQDYDFTQTLTAEQWAWEFLRRNPRYREEWQRFITLWRALEATYGKPAQRNVTAWKLDPRAWVPAESCRESDCVIDGDKVLIECALGASWGFYKFPPDPMDDDPIGGGRLVWREVPQEMPLLAAGMAAPASVEKMALVFDLGLPLTPQLEQAKRRLQIERRRRIAAEGMLPPRIVDHAPRLTRLLRLLDGLQQGAPQSELVSGLSLAADRLERLTSEALALRDGDYRRLLLLD
jgi:hypothetical protein